jgi:hypothetical protein
MISILFWVFLVLYAILWPWPGTPWGQYPWPSRVMAIILFALLGVAVFGLR